MNLIKIDTLSEAARIAFFEQCHGDNLMVVSSGTYVLSELPGYVAIENDQIVAALTYHIKGHVLEIIFLDSLYENRGIGSMLMGKVLNIARKTSVTEIKVITTNDNIRAIRFYQKRGFRLHSIVHDAVDVARQIKPSIPLYSENHIPIQDELIFIMHVSS